MKTLASIALNVGLFAAAWFGFVEGVEGARNLFGFMAWFLLIISASGLTEGALKARASVPPDSNAVRGLRRSIQFGALFVAVWFGEWLAAIPFGLTILFVIAGVARADELRQAKESQA